MLSGGAHETLRIFRTAAGAQAHRDIFALSRDVAAAHLDHRELVAADTPIENLVGAGLGVETPAAVLANEWNRKRPFVFPDDEHGFALTVEIDLVRLLVMGDETRATMLIGDRITGVDQLRAFRPENSEKLAEVIATIGGDQRIDRRCRICEGFLYRGGGNRRDATRSRKADRRHAEPQRNHGR